MIGMSRYLRITSIICLILAFDPILADDPIKCLSLDPNVTSCLHNTCETGYCVSIKRGISNCCKETHCPETGLFSFPEVLPHMNLLHWEEQYDEKTWYRRRQKIGGVEDTLACLFPKSFELNTIASKFNKKSTPTCKTSSECQDNEFCGTVNNPSFCSQSKVCLDKSAEDGLSLTFCFKLPDVKNRMFHSLRKDVGLPVCETNADCKKELPDEVSSCRETEIEIRKLVGKNVKTYQTICAKEIQFDDDEEEESCWKTIALATGISLTICVLLAPIPFYFVHKYRKNTNEAEAAENEAEFQAKKAGIKIELDRQDNVMKINFELLEKRTRDITELVKEDKELNEEIKERGGEESKQSMVHNDVSSQQ